jgi:hypothetical protein
MSSFHPDARVAKHPSRARSLSHVEPSGMLDTSSVHNVVIRSTPLRLSWRKTAMRGASIAIPTDTARNAKDAANRLQIRS